MTGTPDSVLEVDGLWKRYARSSAASRSRAADVFWQAVWGRQSKDTGLRRSEFWALRDVSVRVLRGQALGIIGLNGSGKTTFLRLLSGQLLPERGEIRVLGKSAAIIDLTAGFQQELPGRQNIYLRGAMLGRSESDLRARESQIIEFAELEEVIDAPMASYSAGMRMRLAFAISVAVDPQILLIDEVLAVGDFRFRQKCLARMRELRDRCAFVLVSHNMNDVSRFCDQVMVLHKGQAVFLGEPDEAVQFYQAIERESNPVPVIRGESARGESICNETAIAHAEHAWVDENCNHVTNVNPGSKLLLQVCLTLRYVPKQFVVGVPMWTEDGTFVTGFSTEVSSSDIHVRANEPITLVLEIERFNLVPGRYHSVIGILDGAEYLYRQPNPVLIVDESGKRYWGYTTLDYCWHQR